jgi:hypothetical protein
LRNEDIGKATEATESGKQAGFPLYFTTEPEE